jgi:hypothetical protein
LAAEAMPELLDYLYCSSDTTNITTMNAVALSFLTKYFDMPYLRWMVKEFWKRDIQSHPACEIYYEHAYVMVLDAAAQACSNNILKITPKSHLLHVTDADLWMKVVHDQTSNRMNSRHLSKLIAAFCRNVAVSKGTFRQLTAKEALPDISVNVALQLIDIEREIMSPGDKSLTSLQERCIGVFVRDWRRVNVLRKPSTMKLLRKQNTLVLGELFVRGLSSAARGLPEADEDICSSADESDY